MHGNFLKPRGRGARIGLGRFIASTAALALMVPVALSSSAAAGIGTSPQEITPAVVSGERTPVPMQAIDPERNVTLPQTIPSLESWNAAAKGTWTLTSAARLLYPEAFARQSQVVLDELNAYVDGTPGGNDIAGVVQTALVNAQPEDVVLQLDASLKATLGEEGYRIAISDNGLVITAAETRGLFWGTRTLSQMLRQQVELPFGQIEDKPKYRERGVTLCACQINIQTDFIERLLADMADLKMNYLLLEMKLRSENFPAANEWSYYTRDDVRRLVEMADTYGIDVIPEINSPGHMNVWLASLPEFQLVDRYGKSHEDRLDITNQKAVDFYLNLIDEYDGVFTTDYWHMGADEYMMGTSYNNFPQVQQFAKTQYGAGATGPDAFVGFINLVNQHVKANGKKLRIWNDGVLDTPVVKLDRDIVVEFWDGTGIAPQTLMSRGYELMNANGVLYYSRSTTFFKMNPERLYNQSWHLGKFPGNNNVDPNSPLLRGGKMSIWPDTSYYETENEVEMEMQDSLRYTAQITWTTKRPWTNWQGMKEAIDAIGHPLNWENVTRQPLEPGSYVIESATGADGEILLGANGLPQVGTGTDVWQITPTHDHYYQLRSANTGKCLTVDEGKKRLGVVTEVGAPAHLAPCADVSVQYNPSTAGKEEASLARNQQKWQIFPDGNGTFRLRNALSNQDLSVATGEEVHVDLGNLPTQDPDNNGLEAGQLVQLPPDMSQSLWKFVKQMEMTYEVDNPIIYPGQSATVSVSVTNPFEHPVNDLVVSASAANGELSVEPASRALGDFGPNAGGTVSFKVDAGRSLGEKLLVLTLSSDQGEQKVHVPITVTCGPDVTPRPVSASSEATSGEIHPNGLWTAAFDNNPDTFWHSKWHGGETPHPHSGIMDLGSEQQICSLNYLPRNSSTQGHIKDYEIYVSNDGSTWGDAVATGTLTEKTDWSRIPFTAQGRYLKIVSLSSTANTNFTMAAEFSVTAGELPPPVIEVTPLDPQFVDAVGTGEDKVIIPEVTGVQYLLAGQPVEAGEHVVPANTTDVTVTAQAASADYELASDATTSWSYTFDITKPTPPQDPCVAQNNCTFFLVNDWTSTTADLVFRFGDGTADALVGDWNGDGIDTVALRAGNEYSFRYSNSSGAPNKVLTFGRADDQVLVGDWDGDGVDTLAVRRGNEVFVMNAIKGGNADYSYTYGRADDEVLVGDWNNSGTDSLAVRRGNAFFLRNSATTGIADIVFTYGRAGDVVLVGDWNGDGRDSFTVRRGNAYYMSNRHVDGPAETVLHYGRASDEVIVGDWDNDNIDTIGVYRR